MDSKKDIRFLNRDMMKYIAIFVMFWGHLFAWTVLMQSPEGTDPYETMPVWMAIISHASLFCPPVMFWFVADGYKYTRDRKKYAVRLLIFACITQIPDWLVFQPIYGWRTANVIFTLLFGLLAIMAWESRFRKWQRVLLVVLCAGATLLISADWEIFGVLFILFLHIYRDRPGERFISYTAIALLWKGIAVLWQILGGSFGGYEIFHDVMDLLFIMLAYICMSAFYNGRKGKHPVFAKWFFYVFYPVHYLIIWAVVMLPDLEQTWLVNAGEVQF